MYCFGDEIASLREHDAGIDGLLVSGERRMVDLVVGADGGRCGRGKLSNDVRVSYLRRRDWVHH